MMDRTFQYSMMLLYVYINCKCVFYLLTRIKVINVKMSCFDL